MTTIEHTTLQNGESVSDSLTVCEIDEQVQAVASNFFGSIDKVLDRKDAKIHVAYFASGIAVHEDVREQLMAGVMELCDHIDSNCVQSQLKISDVATAIVESKKSGNLLIEEVHTDSDDAVFGYWYYIMPSPE